MKKTFFLLFIICTSLAFAKEKYLIMADTDFSSYAGAENILSAHMGLEYVENKFLPIPKEKKVIYSLERIGELILFWSPLSELEIVLQHEVFGHGYRVRDIGSSIVTVEKYKIKTPYPYGSGGGATYYSFNSDLTSFLETAISAAGVEASAVLANRLKMKWFSSLRLDPKKAFLYLSAQQDLTSYVYSMNDSLIFANDGHDIESYIYWLNNSYYDDHLSKNDMKQAALVNLFDPITYYSFASFFVYIFSGRDIQIPSIKIKNLSMLPNLRLGLAPYGLEYYFENFMSLRDSAIYSYFRMGSHNNNTYWGLGLEYPAVYKAELTKLGFRLDFYRQPKIYYKEGFYVFENIQVGYSEEDLNKMITGMSAYLIFDKRLSIKSDLSLYAEIGYKTNGFIPGQSLKNSLIFRLALGWNAF